MLCILPRDCIDPSHLWNSDIMCGDQRIATDGGIENVELPPRDQDSNIFLCSISEIICFFVKMYSNDAITSDYRVLWNTAAQQRSAFGSFQGSLKDPDNSRMSKEKSWRKKKVQNDLLSSLNVSALSQEGRCTLLSLLLMTITITTAMEVVMAGPNLLTVIVNLYLCKFLLQLPEEFSDLLRWG